MQIKMGRNTNLNRSGYEFYSEKSFFVARKMRALPHPDVASATGVDGKYATGVDGKYTVDSDGKYRKRNKQKGDSLCITKSYGEKTIRY
jgi:hypothetical protein